MEWTKYNDNFPDRYTKKSRIDAEIKDAAWSIGVSKMTSDSMALTVLDIGGGVYGTFDRDSMPGDCYLLDPNIDKAPDWYNGKVDWENIFDEKFDLIVARGSINYLKPDEIRKITSHLKKTGIFVANTFLFPTTVEREYKVRGVPTGIEKSTYRENTDLQYEWNGVIQHQLRPHDRLSIICHNFYYYDLLKYISFFKPNEVSFETYGSNSVIIKVFGQ